MYAEKSAYPSKVFFISTILAQMCTTKKEAEVETVCSYNSQTCSGQSWPIGPELPKYVHANSFTSRIRSTICRRKSLSCSYIRGENPMRVFCSPPFSGKSEKDTKTEKQKEIKGEDTALKTGNKFKSSSQ